MKQKDLGLDLSTRRTRKQILLDEMAQVMPWGELLALISPLAPVAKTGRLPFDQAMVLRIHCLQQWFCLSDMGAEEALFETSFYRDFVGFSCKERIPVRGSILRFQHLFEEHNLSPKILEVINAKLAAHGLPLKTSTVVDATLVSAPSYTKSETGDRNLAMHQVKKGNQWHFGMKAHIGVDADSGLVHTVIGKPAKVNYVTKGHAIPQGEEQNVFADAGYQGAPKREDYTGVDWHIAMRPGKRKAQKHTPWGALTEQAEKLKASVRAKVEHPFRVIKRQFGHCKVRYRGLAKNTAQLTHCLRCPTSGWPGVGFCSGRPHDCVCKEQMGRQTGEMLPHAGEIGVDWR